MNALTRWALALGLAALAGCSAAPAETAPPDLSPVGVGALGRLEPEWKTYQVAAPAAFEGARIEKLLAREGGQVKRGDVLAELDSLGRHRAALREARAQVGVARARLALVRAGAKPEEVLAQKATVAQLRASLGHAEANLRRAGGLRQSATISVEEFDALATKADTARHALRQGEATLKALQSVRPEDVALAVAELEKAEAGVLRAEADVETSLVRSPISGRVLKAHAREGERVGDKGVAEVGNTDAMEAVAEVHEADVPLVRVGQRATVRLRTRAAPRLEGTVTHVGLLVGRRVVLDNDPVKDADARVVEVRVRLDDCSGVAGLSNAQVEVVIHTAGGK